MNIDNFSYSEEEENYEHRIAENFKKLRQTFPPSMGGTFKLIWIKTNKGGSRLLGFNMYELIKLVTLIPH